MALTPAQVDAAVDYNKRQGYCDHEIKLTQKTVGAAQDGKWGPETVNKVAAWQPSQNLAPDGKVGPQTWTAITSSWTLVPTQPPEAKGPTVGCGLAAYDQTFPGHTPEDALDRAFGTALMLECKEIRFWSSEWLIDDLGNKGNSYSGPWLAKQILPGDVRVGAWIDDPTSVAASLAFVEALIQRKIDVAALMINRSNTRPGDVPWSLRYDRATLEAIGSLYRGAGIDPVATCWPRPSRSQIDAMLADMAWILPTLGSRVFEVDTEGNWDPKFLEGFSTMNDAARYLADGMRGVVGDDGTLELTTFTYHRENSDKAVLAPLMDRLLPQAYSVRHRGNQTVEWEDSLGPGNHQKLAVSRAHQAAVAA